MHDTDAEFGLIAVLSMGAALLVSLAPADRLPVRELSGVLCYGAFAVCVGLWLRLRRARR